MRLAALALALGVAVAACGGDPSSDPSSGGAPSDDGAPAATPSTVDQVASDEPDVRASALDDREDPSFPPPLVDVEEIIAGGPPPDGIPPVDEPRFLDVDDVDFLEGSEAVLSLEVDGDARAYPIQIMIWHELVNDTVGGVPLTVSFCPLCNSALAYDRRVDGRVLDFGTSGSLYRSALVMYDRQTESLWSHFTGQAVVGDLTGAELDLHPVATVSWDDFRAAHPDGRVLSRATGNPRDYGRNPYPGYDDPDDVPFLFEGEVDGRLAVKERVVGIQGDEDAVAVRHAELDDAGVLTLELDGEPLTVWLRPGTASALDDATVAGGRDVGATGVFRAQLDGRTLTFERTPDGFVDDETGSTWDVLGRAVDGELAGEALEPVPHVDTFWFAWAAYLPDTAVVPPLQGG